jgi:hypothetical protein
LLFLPARTNPPSPPPNHQSEPVPSHDKTPPIDRRQEKLTLPHGETGARRSELRDSQRTGRRNPRQGQPNQDRERTARAAGTRATRGGGGDQEQVRWTRRKEKGPAGAARSGLGRRGAALGQGSEKQEQFLLSGSRRRSAAM